MKIKISTTGVQELGTEITEDVQDLVRRITFGIEAASKVLIQTSPASGKIYGNHQASAPGEPPATDTGFLVNSIQAELNGPGDVGTIEVGALYGAILEDGLDRPFIMPSIDKVLSEL